MAMDGGGVDTVYGYGNDATPIRTQNGGTTTVFVKTYPLGSVGPHQLTITVQPDLAPNDAFTFLWAGVPAGNYAETGVPHVIAGGIPAENYGLRSDMTTLYDGVVRSVVTALQADGMCVQFAATHDVLTTLTDYVDILHPNDVGHQKIATAFLNPESDCKLVQGEVTVSRRRGVGRGGRCRRRGLARRRRRRSGHRVRPGS